MLSRLISVAAHPVPGAGEEEGGKGGEFAPRVEFFALLSILSAPATPPQSDI